MYVTFSFHCPPTTPVSALADQLAEAGFTVKPEESAQIWDWDGSTPTLGELTLWLAEDTPQSLLAAVDAMFARAPRVYRVATRTAANLRGLRKTLAQAAVHIDFTYDRQALVASSPGHVQGWFVGWLEISSKFSRAQ